MACFVFALLSQLTGYVLVHIETLLSHGDVVDFFELSSHCQGSVDMDTLHEQDVPNAGTRTHTSKIDDMEHIVSASDLDTLSTNSECCPQRSHMNFQLANFRISHQCKKDVCTVGSRNT